MKKNKPSLREMRDIIHILIIAVPKAEERRKKEYLNKLYSKNFPNLIEKHKLQIHDAQQTSSRENSKIFTHRHIIY